MAACNRSSTGPWTKNKKTSNMMKKRPDRCLPWDKRYAKEVLRCLMDLGPWSCYKLKTKIGHGLGAFGPWTWLRHLKPETYASFPPKASSAMDRCIFSSKQGLQHQAHRSHDPVPPIGAVQAPMVGDMKPIWLHPTLVLHGPVGAIDGTTHLSTRDALPAADPETSQTDAECQEPQHRHANAGPRT